MTYIFMPSKSLDKSASRLPLATVKQCTSQPRSTHPGEQGVIICDGVGTHLGYHVVKKTIDFGMEILLRVPHLSFVLQGEDTVNFKMKYLPACLLLLLLQLFMFMLLVVLLLLMMLLLIMLMPMLIDDACSDVVDSA